MMHKGKVLELLVEWKKNMEKNTERKVRYSIQTTKESIQAIISYSYIIMMA